MPRRTQCGGRIGDDRRTMAPAGTRLVLLTFGGAIHVLLLWQAAAGLLTIVSNAVRPTWEGGGDVETYWVGIWAAALALVAYPFGWFCFRAAGSSRPWRAESAAILTALPVAAIVVTTFAWNAERVRHEIYAGDTDPAATYLVSACAVAFLGAFGAAQFVVFGRRGAHASSVVDSFGR